MTSEQLTRVNEFRAALDKNILNYLTFGSLRSLNLIYFEEGDDVFLQEFLPGELSNDYAGMFVSIHYYRIDKDGNYFEITSAFYQAKKEFAKEIIWANPNA